MIGHSCQGGGAKIENSPINLHIHIHTNDATIAQKIMRSIYGIFGRRHETIEGVERLTGDDVQGRILRACGGR